MSRQAIVYICMMFGCGGLLWAVLGIGSAYLQASPDLSGNWELRPINAEDAAPPARHLAIEQSGKYLRATIDQRVISLKLFAEDPSHLKLVGISGDITVGIKGKDRFDFRSSSLLGGQFTGVREPHAR